MNMLSLAQQPHPAGTKVSAEALSTLVLLKKEIESLRAQKVALRESVRKRSHLLDSLRNRMDGLNEEISDPEHKQVVQTGGTGSRLTAHELALKTATSQSKAKLSKVKPSNGLYDPTIDAVHCFYYPWYSNPKIDGHYFHWNHERIKHWNKDIAKRFSTKAHDPLQDDIGSNYYPVLGTYSSADPTIMAAHMQNMLDAGIGVAVISWFPKGKADTNGNPGGPDALMPLLLKAAEDHGMKVALHLEPYEGRTAASVVSDVRYILDTYGEHPSFYRHHRRARRTDAGGVQALGKGLPLIYVYDSYRIPDNEWAPALNTFRASNRANHPGQAGGALFICLVVESRHRTCMNGGGFDGAYSYFGSRKFSFGAQPERWGELATYAEKYGKIFIPSVAPGYIDTQVRPWNGENTQGRRGGAYYDDYWRSAIAALAGKHFLAGDLEMNLVLGGPKGAGEEAVVPGRIPSPGSPARTYSAGIVSVTSFNEWHEGTQIEPAVTNKRSKKGFRYMGYEQDNWYLTKTNVWSERLRAEQFGALGKI
jgi:glycoprotein endo-alpha-1,2-mannosidase